MNVSIYLTLTALLKFSVYFVSLCIDHKFINYFVHFTRNRKKNVPDMDNEKPAEKMSEGRFSPNDNDRGYINGREKDPTCDLERGYLIG